MKRILSFAIVLLALASTFTCWKEDNGHVPYKPCDCEKEKMNIGLELFNGEAILFKDLPEEQHNEKIYGSGKRVIFYNSETDYTVLYVYSNILYRAYICNFPNFAKVWNIPQDGKKVYYRGTMYHACNPYGTADAVYTDIILTTLNPI
jgi:hypothetical protein